MRPDAPRPAPRRGGRRLRPRRRRRRRRQPAPAAPHPAALGAAGLLSLWAVLTRFALDTDVVHLFPEDLPWRQAEIAIDRAFPQRIDLIAAVIDGATPGCRRPRRGGPGNGAGAAHGPVPQGVAPGRRPLLPPQRPALPRRAGGCASHRAADRRPAAARHARRRPELARRRARRRTLAEGIGPRRRRPGATGPPLRALAAPPTPPRPAASPRGRLVPRSSPAAY